MTEPGSTGLARLQSQSRIAASKWREWCVVLDMAPDEAVEVWEEICHPIMLSTRQVPPVAQILQLRVDRRRMSIFDFKDEVAKPLAFFSFLANLRDENLTKGGWKPAILAFYRKSLAGTDDYRRAAEEIDRFVIDMCTAVVVAKVLKKGNISLHSVLSVLVKGNASLDNLSQLARQSLGDARYADAVERFLDDERVALDVSVAVEAAVGEVDRLETSDEIGASDEIDVPKENGERAFAEGSDSASGHPEVEIEAEIDVGDFDLGGSGEEEEEEEEETEEEGVDVMGKFRSALRGIYNVETARDRSIEKTKRVALIRERSELISSFDPLRVVVPSMEEAQAIVGFSQTSQGGKRIHKPVMKAPRPSPGASATARSTGGGGGASGGASGAAIAASSGGAAPISIGKSVAGGGDANKAEDVERGTKKKRPRAATAAVDSDGVEEQAESTATAATGNITLGGGMEDPDGEVAEEDEGIQVAEEDLVQLVRVRAADFSQVVRLTGQLLAVVEPEEVVWQQYLEPGIELDEVAKLAEQVANKGSGANKAYGAIKALAQRLPLKEHIAVPDAVLQKDRKFAIEVPAYMNSLANNKMAITPSDRQLAPLAKILDVAAASLMRLENLRVNHLLSEQHPEEYDAESVVAYRDTALAAVLSLADTELLEQARDRAVADTEEMLAIFHAERFAEQLLEEVREFVSALAEEGHTNSFKELTAVLAEHPLQFELTVPEDHVPPPPEALKAHLEPGALGEIFDAVCEHVCTRAWTLLSPEREPDKVVGRIKNIVRELIPANFILQPEKKRHSERPRIALSVISLDKVSGNTLLKDLFVRVGVGGRIFFVDGFQGGNFVDLFELREYTPVRIQSNTGAVEGLQTGEKYLYTVGRTNRIFAATPEEVMSTCIREEDESIKVFPVFRASTRS